MEGTWRETVRQEAERCREKVRSREMRREGNKVSQEAERDAQQKVSISLPLPHPICR
jgi:hypothetical protein